MNQEQLTQIKQGMRVRIVKLCNEEAHYKSGDEGTVEFIDDAGQVHVLWNKGGSIALLPFDGDIFDVWTPNEQILKKVKENFKKKRARWRIFVGIYTSMQDAYDMAENVFNYLDNQFNEDEKERYIYRKVTVGTIPVENGYKIEILFQK